MNKEEILKALEVIKKVCSEADMCEKCPLINVKTEMCYMQDLTPEDWNIKKDTEEKWRAFYDWKKEIYEKVKIKDKNF